MGQRLHDAVIDLLVRFNEQGQSQEFTARIRAEKLLPVSVDVQRDYEPKRDGTPGGIVRIETRAPIVIEKRIVVPLQSHYEDRIDTWVAKKRRELYRQAEAVMGAGAKGFSITNEGTVVSRNRNG